MNPVKCLWKAQKKQTDKKMDIVYINEYFWKKKKKKSLIITSAKSSIKKKT